MAKESNKVTTFLNLAFMLSIILIITASESRSFFGAVTKGSPTLSCQSVVGVVSGDTCFDIAKDQNLSTTAFDAINPNLNCSALFIGQWLCVSGSII
ncbi:hypothetical protein SASPL_144570 [Salvia splendens]|uniref:LysM domain-containing protein n=1 Tax=Salvia splendens TaxID=180675 RepID=A0A8X8WGL5_SALSN|nr:hypothetical protein SASPL_144570 [Salvia splendens]